MSSSLPGMKNLTSVAAFLFLLGLSTYARAQQVVLSATFNSWAQGFTYADDTFRGTTQPGYAVGNFVSTGGFAGGGLRVIVGGVNNTAIEGMSGGWSKAFSVSGNGSVSITLKYRLVFPAAYEPDECGQALVSLDGVLVGPGPGDFLQQFCGTGVVQNSEWQTATFAVVVIGGAHTLTVGGWNNKKNASAEKTTIFFDDIVVTHQQSTSTFLSDGFADGNADGWVVVDDSGSSSNWQVINGEYQQLNAVGASVGGAYVDSYHKGTYAYYQNGSTWTNYQATVRVTPLLQGAQNTVGLMFRYQNNNNYYRFSISRRQGFSRLEKKVQGTFTTLAFDGRGFTFDQPLQITVILQNSKIFVYLDNTPLFSVLDSSIGSGSVALFTRNNVKFDDVVVMPRDSNPRVVVSQPTGYSIETITTLAVSAQVILVPTGGGVRFTLDEGTADARSFSVFASPYAGTFSSVAPGTHELDTVIVKSSGTPVSKPTAQDQNVQVGVGGAYFVGLGDSITQGVGDDAPSDDSSADGRNVNWGYTPILNDLLSIGFSKPFTVLNEGLPGTVSKHGLDRLTATKARHAKSQYWLILFGTNDSGGAMPVPSGFGLQSGDSGYSGSYKDNLQRIITSLKNAGKIPLLAKVPVALGPCSDCTPYTNPLTASRNLLVQEYNQVIDELVAANAIPVVPPDLFTYFANHQNQFSDNLHPNGNGYAAIADLWRTALVASGILN